MRIIELTNSWPAETFISRHVDALSQLPDTQISIIANDLYSSRSASVDNSSSQSNKVKHLRNYYSTHKISRIHTFLKSPLTLWTDINTTYYVNVVQPDVLHFHHIDYAIKFRKFLKNSQIPYTVSVRGSDIQIHHLVLPRDYLSNLKSILSNASRIHSVCDTFHSQIHQLCDKDVPIETIRTCVQTPTEPPKRLETNSINLISVGRLHWTKAYDDLIRAIALLPDFELNIVGDGPEKKHLTFLIYSLGLQDRVNLLGKLNYHEFEQLLVNATAYVQSSISEGFSNSLAEAMALGKACFVTEAGGTSEVIKDGENGLYIPMGDARGIADKLIIAQDTALLKRLAQSAFTTAQQKFATEKHALAFRNFFSETIKSQ